MARDWPSLARFSLYFSCNSGRFLKNKRIYFPKKSWITEVELVFGVNSVRLIRGEGRGLFPNLLAPDFLFCDFLTQESTLPDWSFSI